MKRTIFTLIDKHGNSKDAQGNAYGFFLGNEQALCEEYCKGNGLEYRQDVVNICDPVRK